MHSQIQPQHSLATSHSGTAWLELIKTEWFHCGPGALASCPSFRTHSCLQGGRKTSSEGQQMMPGDKIGPHGPFTGKGQLMRAISLAQFQQCLLLQTLASSVD